MLANRDNTPIKIGDKSITPIEIASYILKYIKEEAEKSLKRPIKKAVITIPAYFSEIAR